MKYENFEEAKDLVEKIDKYKKILNNIESVTNDVDREYIETKVIIQNKNNDVVSTILEIEELPCTFAHELLNSYREHIELMLKNAMMRLEQL